LTVPKSEGRPPSKTIRHFHCARNPSGKDQLPALEIHDIARRHFLRLRGAPCSSALKFKDGDTFDPLIRGWTRYWNEVLKPKEALDANLVKALIASESGFDRESGKSRKGRNAALGLMRINAQAVAALRDERGEIKEHYVTLEKKDRLDPKLCICAGVRWLFQKKAMASHKLGSEATWDEAVEEYKGVLRERLKGRRVNPNVMGAFRKYLKELEKC
jgi:hypothetical protein